MGGSLACTVPQAAGLMALPGTQLVHCSAASMNRLCLCKLAAAEALCPLHLLCMQLAQKFMALLHLCTLLLGHVANQTWFLTGVYWQAHTFVWAGLCGLATLDLVWRYAPSQEYAVSPVSGCCCAQWASLFLLPGHSP